MGDPILRSEQALLFPVEADEQQRSLGPFRQQGECLGQFQQGCHPAGIVVGAVVNLTDRAAAVPLVSPADVVVMRAEDDHLVVQLWVASLLDRQHVAQIGRKGLEEPAIGACPSKTELGQLRRQVLAGGVTAMRARLPPFHGIARQHHDVLLELPWRDRLQGRHVSRVLFPRHGDGGPEPRAGHGNHQPASGSHATRRRPCSTKLR